MRCVVACHNAGGEPDLFGVEVSCSAREYERGEHYEKARGAAEGPFVVFDEDDGPEKLFGPFDWEEEDAGG